jgi:hypothetical protein
VLLSALCLYIGFSSIFIVSTASAGVVQSQVQRLLVRESLADDAVSSNLDMPCSVVSGVNSVCACCLLQPMIKYKS